MKEKEDTICLFITRTFVSVCSAIQYKFIIRAAIIVFCSQYYLFSYCSLCSFPVNLKKKRL